MEVNSLLRAKVRNVEKATRKTLKKKEKKTETNVSSYLKVTSSLFPSP